MKLIVFKEEGFAINIDKIEWISYYSANKTHIFVGDSDSQFTVHKPFEEVVKIIYDKSEG